MSTDRDIGMLVGRVEALTETVKSLDTHNSNQHQAMFSYIDDLKGKVSQVEIEQAGMRVFNEGLSENLTMIIGNIGELKINVSKDILELRSVMLIQLQQNLFSKINQFFKDALIPFIQTKAGFIIAVIITVVVIYVLAGYYIGFDKILLLIDRLLKRS